MSLGRALENSDYPSLQKQQRSCGNNVTDGIYLEIGGRGIDTTPQFTGITSPVVLGYNHSEYRFSAALLQSGVSAITMPDGISVRWKALYGYHPGMREIRMHGSDPQWWERNAFAFGYKIAQECYEMLASRPAVGQVKGVDRLNVPRPHEVAGERIVEVVLEEVKAMRDRVIDRLENVYFHRGIIRETQGHYRWIGLSTQHRKLTTPAKIPKMIGESLPLHLTASLVPLDGTGRQITPYRDDIAQSVLSGILHGLEGRPKWSKTCSITAAMLQYCFGDRFDLETLLAAAARAGLFPRLGSTLRYGMATETSVYRVLAALAIAWDFFRTYYVEAVPRNEGEVAYLFSGSGVSKVLEEKVKRYVNSAFLHVKGGAEGGGLTFFPASNAFGSLYSFDFVQSMDAEQRKADLTMISQAESPQHHVVWDSNPVTISSDLILTVQEEEKMQYSWRPTLIEPSRSIRHYVRFVGAGLRTNEVIIKDRIDGGRSYQPSALFKSLILGWAPAYSPSSILLTGLAEPSSLEKFFNFDWRWGTDLPEFAMSKPRRGPGVIARESGDALGDLWTSWAAAVGTDEPDAGDE